MPNFPYKLHELLERVDEDEELRSIISWLPDGNTFKIHSQEAFEQRLLREYFPRQTQVKSFMRQLQYYDFENFGEGIFRHRCFVRGQRNLCGQIMHQLPTKNQKQSGKSTRQLKTRGRKKKSATAAISGPTAAAVASFSADTTTKLTATVASAWASFPQLSLGGGSTASVASASSESDHSAAGNSNQPPQQEEPEPAPRTPNRRQPSQVSFPTANSQAALTTSETTPGDTRNLQHTSPSVGPLHRQMSTIPYHQQQQQQQQQQNSLAQQLMAHQSLLAAQNVRANYLSGLQDELLLGSMWQNQRYLAIIQAQQQQQHQHQHQHQHQMNTTSMLPAGIQASLPPNNNFFLDCRIPQSYNNLDLERLQADAISNHIRKLSSSSTSSPAPSMPAIGVKEDELSSLNKRKLGGSGSSNFENKKDSVSQPTTKDDTDGEKGN